MISPAEFEEVMSHYPHLPNGERQKYKSMYMQQMKLSTGNGASSSNAAEASGVHASTAVGGSSYSIPAANSSTRCGSNGSSRQAEPISKETLTCAQELASCGTLYSEQKLAKARELCDAGVAAWRGKDVSTAVSKLSAGELSQDNVAMFTPTLFLPSYLQQVGVIDVEMNILHTFQAHTTTPQCSPLPQHTQ